MSDVQSCLQLLAASLLTISDPPLCHADFALRKNSVVPPLRRPPTPSPHPEGFLGELTGLRRIVDDFSKASWLPAMEVG